MSNVVIFNFQQISSIADFYQQFGQQFSLPTWFGQNLDALWDMLCAEIEFPVVIVFTNMTLEQQNEFTEIVSMMREAHDMFGDEFIFVCENDSSVKLA